MKTYLNIFLTLAIALLAASCSKEDPFHDSVTGKVNTRSLTVEVANEENTRAANVDVADFTVQFFKQGETTAQASYRYGDMPEVVELPVGTYTARATYGQNLSAAWDAPYYEGNTLSTFEVKADQVTMVADPIVCALSNVKVSVYFSDELTAQMSANAKVSVKVGEHGTELSFTKADEGREGYFAYVADSPTLAATFAGEVQGFETVETKVYDDVKPGNYYKITFTLHEPELEPGDVSLNLRVDATVQIEDVNRTIGDEDEILIDDMRPKEDPGNEPGPGGDDKKEAPTLVAQAPISFDGVNDVNASSQVVINVKSTAAGGFTEFKVRIVSESLSPSELQTVGLTDVLDLVNPGQFWETLDGLELMPNHAETVAGMTEVRFDISQFMQMLAGLGPDTHNFEFTVSDANGTTTQTLTLRVTE